MIHGFAAELPVIRLDTVFPPGGKAGSEVPVAIAGADLDEAKALHFSRPGLTAEPKDKGFVVKIAAETPPGIYDLRVAGLLGISNPRAFVVSDLPQAVKSGVHNQPETAIDLPLNSSMAGSVAAATADYFKFTATKGERLMIECEAAEIDSRLKPTLAALDAAGQELETSRHGGLLDFTAPADGSYLIRLNDLTFAGGAEYFYRLTLTSGPHLDFVFPPCIAPGAKGKFTLYGRNLPGGGPANLTDEDGQPLEKLEIEIEAPAKPVTDVDGLSNPAAATVDGFSYRLKGPMASNAVFIGFAAGPIVTEQEPNNTPAQAQKITPPCEVVGQLYPAGDVDTYSFDAKKGEVWWVEAISNRLDLPTNPFLLIQKETADVQEAYAAEANIGGIRFNTASHDPALRFEVKEDGAYRVSVRDLFGNVRSDPRMVYRLAIRKESPDFRLVALAEPPPEKKDDRSATPRASLVLAEGVTAIKVLALRRDGFAGDIALSAEGLPGGAKCLPSTIDGNANEGFLFITCEKPEPWAGAIRVLGQAKIGDAEVVREARGGVVRWSVVDANLDVVHPRLTRDIALAVSGAEAAPISMAAAEEKRWEIAAGGKIEIPLKVTRRGQFKEALKLKAAGVPGILPMKEIDVAANAATASAMIDLASLKIPAGEHTIYFEAQTKGKFRGKDVLTTVFSAPIRIAVEPPKAK